ncbi:MAG: hypothetical protein M5U28_40775 [Sandaracinaceae bacterium]|nr:hypothetical protein [Sandaracinaceae bacterium]
MLVAGLGNVFFGDDGFGVEVARCLAAAPPPPPPRAWWRSECAGWICRARCASRSGCSWPSTWCRGGGRPGTLYLLDGAEASATGGSTDLLLALAAARAARRSAPRVCVVGCEPGVAARAEGPERGRSLARSSRPSRW